MLNYNFIPYSITSIYDLQNFRQEVLTKVVEHFSRKVFPTSKPKFKFEELKISFDFHHFYFYLNDIEFQVSFSKLEIADFYEQRMRNYHLDYFDFIEKHTVKIIDLQSSDVWQVLGGLELNKERIEKAEKILYGRLGYCLVKLRRLLSN